MKRSYEICEVSEDGGWGEHFLFMWRFLLTAEMHYHFWLWKELVIISLEGTRFKVGGHEEGGRRAASMFSPNTTCSV